MLLILMTTQKSFLWMCKIRVCWYFLVWVPKERRSKGRRSAFGPPVVIFVALWAAETEHNRPVDKSRLKRLKGRFIEITSSHWTSFPRVVFLETQDTAAPTLKHWGWFSDHDALPQEIEMWQNLLFSENRKKMPLFFTYILHQRNSTCKPLAAYSVL